MSLRTILLSPLFHFFLLGGAIFAGYAVLNDDPAPPRTDVIVLSETDADRLIDRFTATWRRPPTAEELDGLIRSWALEEAYVREALALGLDRGDGVIRQRLALKMRFIAESGAAALHPDDAELQDWLADNAERFRSPARMAFEQVLLDPALSEDAVTRLRDRLAAGEDPQTIGRASMLPHAVPMTPGPAIDRTFGTGFHDKLGALPGPGWQGPVQSAFGQHLVRVTGQEPAVAPDLDAVRDTVETEWRAAQARRLQEEFGQALLDGYTLELPDAADVLSR